MFKFGTIFGMLFVLSDGIVFQPSKDPKRNPKLFEDGRPGVQIKVEFGRQLGSIF